MQTTAKRGLLSTQRLAFITNKCKVNLFFFLKARQVIVPSVTMEDTNNKNASFLLSLCNDRAAVSMKIFPQNLQQKTYAGVFIVMLC
uniref:Uncharacterized protein n=1 Tax=Rhipicephalus zambeziensis TaxID=60191 RepID=A0A224Y5U4_9ACAR